MDAILFKSQVPSDSLIGIQKEIQISHPEEVQTFYQLNKQFKTKVENDESIKNSSSNQSLKKTKHSKYFIDYPEIAFQDLTGPRKLKEISEQTLSQTQQMPM